MILYPRGRLTLQQKIVLVQGQITQTVYTRHPRKLTNPLERCSHAYLGNPNAGSTFTNAAVITGRILSVWRYVKHLHSSIYAYHVKDQCYLNYFSNTNVL